MKTTASAYAYLIDRTVRNRIARQIARVKTPRYLIALIVGGLYLWFFLIRRSGSPPTSPAAVATVLGSITAVGFAITVIVWWFGKGPKTALAFQPADVQFLFAGPVSRRSLIAYKLARSQLLLLVNALVMSVLIRRWGVTLPAPLRYATAWGFFTVLSLHRLGVALVATTPIHGGAGRRIARWFGRAVAAAIVVTLVAGTWPALLRLGDVGFDETIRLVGDALATPPASYAMAPFRLVVAPSFAASMSEWIRAFAIVLAIIALHVVWVIGMRIEFEEEAATASVEVAKRRAAFRERRSGGASMITATKVKRDWLPLRPVGLPAVAIAWKNTIALARTGAVRSAIIFIVVAIAASRVMASGSHPNAGAALASPYLLIAGMLLVLGPRVLRNDLRQDLLHLPLLKSYPLRGAEVVGAEMASGTVILTGMQLGLCVIAWFSVPSSVHSALGAGRTLELILILPFALLVLNAGGLAIQNGAALMFPGWVRLGADAGGVEATGQNLLVAVGSLFALLVMLIVPAILGAVTLFVVRPTLGDIALPIGGAAIVVVLGVEVALLVVALGRVFERTDPSALG